MKTGLTERADLDGDFDFVSFQLPGWRVNLVEGIEQRVWLDAAMVPDELRMQQVVLR